MPAYSSRQGGGSEGRRVDRGVDSEGVHDGMQRWHSREVHRPFTSDSLQAMGMFFNLQYFSFAFLLISNLPVG